MLHGIVLHIEGPSEEALSALLPSRLDLKVDAVITPVSSEWILTLPTDSDAAKRLARRLQTKLDRLGLGRKRGDGLRLVWYSYHNGRTTGYYCSRKDWVCNLKVKEHIEAMAFPQQRISVVSGGRFSPR